MVHAISNRSEVITKQSELGSLPKRAYLQIKRMILSGELAPGNAVVERALAAKMKMSRAPIREALLEIEKEGFIQRVGSGARIVPQVTLRDVIEIYELREMVEGMASCLLARHVGAEDIAEIHRLARRMDASPVADEPDEIRFHSLILERCGNSRLSQLAEPIRQQWAKLRFHEMLSRATTGGADGKRQSLVPHGDIVEAIASGDSERAEAVARKHVRYAREKLLREALGETR